MEILAVSLSKWLFKKGYIKNDQLNDIRYGVEVILSNFISLISIILIGLIIHQIKITTLFLFVFIGLRFMYEGYHAKKFLSCLLLTVSSYLTCLIIFLFTPPSIRFEVNIGLGFLNLVLLLSNQKSHKIKLFFVFFILFNITNLFLSFYNFQNIFLFITSVGFVFVISDYYEYIQFKHNI